MSEIVPAASIVCVGCGTGNPIANVYCGGCGHRIVRRGKGTLPHPGYSSPRRLLFISSAVFVVSFVISFVSFGLIQVTGAVSFGLGGPIVNALLDVANVTSVRVPGSPSDAVSFLLISTFLLSTLLAAASAVGATTGGIWLLLRWRDSDAPERVGAAAGNATAATGVRSLAVAESVKDNAADRYEEVAPVVLRAARDGRAKFDAEVTPRVSSGIRKGTEKYRDWVKARRAR
jgi:hypothetical protein